MATRRVKLRTQSDVRRLNRRIQKDLVNQFEKAIKGKHTEKIKYLVK